MTIAEALQIEGSDSSYQHLDDYQYVFESPAPLNNLIRSNPQLSPFTVIRHIRLGVLQPLVGVPLTELELNGGIDGPNIQPLVMAWRNAFQELHAQHNLHSIQFDMSCTGEEIQLREIVRLLQHISTPASVKGEGPLCCSVVGYAEASIA